MPRTHPHRHLQLRRRSAVAGAQGGRVRRGETVGRRHRDGDRGVCARAHQRVRAYRWRGLARDPRCLLHGHLDVVPADAADWTHPPFAAEIDEDEGVPMVWGRGAVDMKDMDAMILAVVRERQRSGRKPPRDLVLAFLADEEAGGHFGSHWLVDHRPDLFEGVDAAVGEVGGFSFTVRDDLRLYLIETAEKGIAWMKLTANGRAGHGSMVNHDNAVTKLAEAVARLGNHQFPLTMTKTVSAFMDAVREALGLDPDTDPDEVVQHLRPIAPLVGAALRNSAAAHHAGCWLQVERDPRACARSG